MILSVADIDKSFGGVNVLDQIGFDLMPGQIKGLIGPNGAGKTTLFNIITGMYRPDNGTVHLQVNGSPLQLHRLKPHQIARAGVGRTFQKPSIAWHLTVFENVLLGAMNQGQRPSITGRKSIREWTEHCLAAVEIEKRLWHVTVDIVPIAVIKKIEFARAVSLAPALILFDEICSGLSHEETDAFIRLIRTYREKEKTGILFVEHDIRAVKNLCEEVAVIDFGNLIYDGNMDDAFKDPRVIKAYIGDEHA